MSVTFYAPVIFTRNIEHSKKFYMDLLEQEIEHDFGKNIIFKSRLSLWEIDPESEIAAVTGNSSNVNKFELYFETEDIANSRARLKIKDVELLHDIKTEPWGQKTFRFFDPDHHLVEVGESMNTFVTRIYKETNSIASTSEKTGISEETIKAILNKSTE